MLTPNMKIHQRGFYGSGYTGIMRKENPPENYVNRPLDAPKVTVFVANEQVASLFNTYVQQNYSQEDFNWMANALAVMLRAFGNSSLQSWHAQQYKSAYFGATHVDFLEDCFRFALTGRSNIDVYTWHHLLSPATEQALPEQLKEYTERYLGKREVYPFNNNTTTITTLFTDILRHPGGMDFLFNMVNTMFTGKI